MRGGGGSPFPTLILKIKYSPLQFFEKRPWLPSRICPDKRLFSLSPDFEKKKTIVCTPTHTQPNQPAEEEPPNSCGTWSEVPEVAEGGRRCPPKITQFHWSEKSRPSEDAGLQFNRCWSTMLWWLFVQEKISSAIAIYWERVIDPRPEVPPNPSPCFTHPPKNVSNMTGRRIHEESKCSKWDASLASAVQYNSSHLLHILCNTNRVFCPLCTIQFSSCIFCATNISHLRDYL